MSEAASVDVADCAREPIHIPGSIQPHGALLALSLPDRIVTQVAGDTATTVGIAPEALVGRAFDTLFDPVSLEHIHDILEAGGDPPLYALGLKPSSGDRLLDGVIHVTGQTAIVELQARADGEGDMSRALGRVRRMMSAVQGSSGTLAFLQSAAEQVRAATGFDRVMIYRFRPDDSGEVIAEAAEEALEPYLGLRYPASDIPSQARALYKRSWLRLIDDVDYVPAPVSPPIDPTTGAPLDMTLCALRSVSPIHVEYLKNMGVAASMSISIVIGDRLWGLIACHHYSGPRHMTFELRATCELFGQMFSLQLEARTQAESFERRLASRRTHETLIQNLARQPNFGDALTNCRRELLDYVDSSGVALIVGGRFHALGRTPDESDVRALAGWLAAEGHGGVFQTDRLAELWLPAADFLVSAAGVLALCVSGSGADYILWFRPEVAREVAWAGNPDKAVGAVDGRISPRRSFAEWTEIVRGRSEPWTEFEIEAAEVLRLSLLELVVRRLDEANAERAVHEERQNLLMAELDHRVKNTLANIQALVAQTSKNGGSLESFTRNLEKRIRSMAKAQSLLTKARWEGVSVRSLLHEELVAYESAGNVTLTGPAASLKPKTALALSLAIHELATNAAKYGALSIAEGSVRVTWRVTSEQTLEISWVEQDGPAVSPPQRRGFGSTLIERALAIETGGSVELSFLSSGVRCTITVPSNQLSDVVTELVVAAPVEATPTSQPGLRVLIVEDSALVLMSLEAMIEDMGWTVSATATRVDEAIALAKHVETDVAVLDVNLDGDTSWEIAETLRARGVPFVFATGYDGTTVLPPSLAGARIIGKPFQPETLSAILTELARAA